MIDGSEKCNRQLAFELQNSHVCDKRSNELVERICLKIKVFSMKLLLYIFSQHFLLIMY